MGGLGRVNLLVGTNNSGKTSVLEAIHLLTSIGDPSALWQVLWRRGERLPPSISSPDRPNRRPSLELDVSHLFNGHEALSGSVIRIGAQSHGHERIIEYGMTEVHSRDQPELFSDDDAIGSRPAIAINGIPKPLTRLIPLSRAAGIYSDAFDTPVRRRMRSYEGVAPAMFITTESITGDELVAMWNKIALTPLESLVLRALQFLEPRIERIASQSLASPYYLGQGRGGFILKLKGLDQPVPIGSMGDGMWRMLAMAIAITQCKDGVLLVDEIDTGLHYSVMTKMWRLIFGAAKEFDVQVFATTHSSDCIRSLAELSHDVDGLNSVTVQRIEIGRERSVRYDPEELAIAAEREIEVR
jgi:hypothetical protein